MAVGRIPTTQNQAVLKRLLPHTLIMVAVFVYTIGGGYIFYWIEHPHRAASLEMETTASTDQVSTGHSPSATDSATTSTFSSTAYVHTTASTTAASANPGAPTGAVIIDGSTRFASTLGNDTTTTRRSRPRKQAKLNDEKYEDEDDDGPEAVKKKKCNRRALSKAVESAREDCILAPNKGKTDEYRAHSCASGLAQLSFCIREPGFTLEEGTTAIQTTTTTTTTTTPATVVSTTSPTVPPSSPSTPMIQKYCDSPAHVRDLTPSSYIFMAFTIISTIGYGHVAPVTVWGRVFCIVYGLIGIPLALLAIADQGRFLSAAVMCCFKKSKAAFNRRCRRRGKGKIEGEGPDEESMPALLLLVLFGAYLLIGGAILTPFEKDWSFIDAVYFTFISSSSIGFGDLLPQEGPYLPVTLLYVALGLALSTAAIDVFAGYLRQLHHFGKKIRNCANKFIWFGSEKVTLSQLVRNIGVQLGVSEDKINHLVEHFDEIVATTIEQGDGVVIPPTPSVAPLLVEEEQTPEPIKAFTCDVDFIDDKDDF